MFQSYVSNHTSPQTNTTISGSKTPAALAPILSTPELSRATLAGTITTTALASYSGLAHIVRIDHTNATNHQLLTIATSLASASPITAMAVRFEVASGTVPTAIPSTATYYPIQNIISGTFLSVRDAVTIETIPTTSSNDVYAGVFIFSNAWVAGPVSGVISVNQVNREVSVLQPLK